MKGMNRRKMKLRRFRNKEIETEKSGKEVKARKKYERLFAVVPVKAF
jgi:hypothetical protein